MQTQTIEYRDQDTLLEAFYAYDENRQAKKPAVLICHDWTGRNPFVHEKAKKLAELGYLGFALDMYGKGKSGKTKEEKSALMMPLMENRSFLRQRIQAALNTAQSLPQVDPHKMAAIGFCFGGLCVLDLARSGADLCGVVSFHGILMPPEQPSHASIKAKILALHGYDDPMVLPGQVNAFAQEMTKSKADWQIHMYGHTMHAFTNPEAHDPDFGTVYEAKADQRSWRTMKDFLAEVFG